MNNLVTVSEALLSIPEPSLREGPLSFQAKSELFLNVAHATLDSEHFAIAFCENYFFCPFNILCHTSVFSAVDIHDPI